MAANLNTARSNIYKAAASKGEDVKATPGPVK